MRKFCGRVSPPAVGNAELVELQVEGGTWRYVLPEESRQPPHLIQPCPQEGDVLRLISARLAEPAERRRYEDD